jgi:elongation factor P--beta-lysine ligase
VNWRPTAAQAGLKRRADLLHKTRQFFKERSIL